MSNVDKCSLLIVDDEHYLLPTLAALLGNDFEVITADSAEAAQEAFARREIDIVLTDQKMPRVTGIQLLEWVRQRSPKTVRLLMTGYAELEGAIEAINRGQVYYYLLKPWRTEELLQVLRNAADKFWLERSREQLLGELRRLNQDLERRIVERTRELEEANRLLQQRTRELEEANHLLHQRSRELEMLALTDPLTGLLNRRAIDDAAQLEVKRHLRYRNPLALGLIDADHFREINKRYYHTGGDQVLISLAKILTGSVRMVDTVGRIGGEEFLVLAPETDLDGAQVLAERIRATVERSRITYKGEPIRVTVSVGFAVADTGAAADYDQMKHVAAAALGEAKARGRNCCVVRPVRPRDFEEERAAG
ncbi:MAG TPA: diguanylate cyclase [Gemmataceae bacterium]|nr:diguanylate cyclase [Gemmataceae bacterium]